MTNNKTKTDIGADADTEIGNDAEATKAARAFLTREKQEGARLLKAAVAFTLCSAALLITQCRLLAVIVTAVVFDKQPLAGQSVAVLSLTALLAARAALSYFSDLAAFRAAEQITESLKARLMREIFRRGPALLAKEQPGALVATITAAVDALHPYYARYITGMALTSVLPLVILLLVLPVDWISGVILLVTAPLIPVFMILIGRGAEALNRKQWRKLTYMGGYFLDAVQGLVTLKMFAAGKRETAMISRICDDYRLESMRPLRVAFLSSLVLEFLATVSIAMVAVLVGFRLMWGDIDFLRGFFVLLLAPEFYLPLRRMGVYYHTRMDAMAASEKIAELLTVPVDMPQSATLRTENGIEIELQNASLHYDGKTALAPVSLRLPAGACLALTGPSGAGKSSLLSLLLKFNPCDTGRILANGQDLATLDTAAWRKHISWVPQKPHIYRATLLENILLGAPDVPREMVESMAKDFYVDEIARTLPLGYDTLIGDGGARLSGGEIQRVALLRAFLRPSSLLLLDEPTAHLDLHMRGRVLSAIDRHAKGRSVILVSHRVEEIPAHADIYRIDNDTLSRVAAAKRGAA